MGGGKFRKRRGGNQGGGRRDRGGEREKPEGQQNDRRGNYKLAVKENEMFETYYKGQNIVKEDEFDQFMSSLREPLPATFRITGSKSEAKEVLKVIKSDYLQNLVNIEIEGAKLDPPKCLPWYPDGLAWQLNLDRKVIRNYEALSKLKTFLVSETESGNISRQEAVSMIPPLLLDIQPHHKVLDMCAAPGSKTAQLVEFLHCDEKNPVPEGVVVANDSDNKRCYLMVHQVKRLASPCFMIINHDASHLPNLRLTPEGTSPKKFLNFDRVLADVPCSGDGTMRKNPDVWSKWTPASAQNLHGLQSRILRRGLELLEVGGRLVYSTCSFNPLENEAVVANLLQKCEGGVELIDTSGSLPGLIHNPGLTKWRVFNRKSGEWYNSFEEVPENLHTQIRPAMFPPAEDEAKKLGLAKCIRVLPHHQNTGGFFIAVMKKVKQVPWFNKSKAEVVTERAVEEKKEDIESDQQQPSADNGQQAATESAEAAAGEKRKESDSSEVFDPPQKKRKLYGYKEDPFLFLDADEQIWPSVKEFYGIDDSFPVEQLMVRCKEGKKRNIYFASKITKTIVEHNADRIKFINMGIKLLNRSESQYVKCDFRLVQDGVLVLNPYIKSRRINITSEDIMTILGQENPYISRCTEKTQKQLTVLDQGGVLFTYEPEDDNPDSPQCKMVLCGWKGKTSTRSFLPKYQRAHFLRLCGMELQERDSEQSSSDKKTIDVFSENADGSKPTEDSDMKVENNGSTGDTCDTKQEESETKDAESSCDSKPEVETSTVKTEEKVEQA